MSAAAYPATSPRPAAWWSRLLITDFRHALAPWVIYIISLLYTISALSINSMYVFWFTIFLAVPAIIVQVLCSDFSYGTMATLLTFPVPRWKTLLARMILLAVLIAIPLTVALLFPRPDLNKFPVTINLVLILTTQYSLGSLYALLFKAKPVAWTAVVISPAVVAALLAMLKALTNWDDNINNSPFPDNFIIIGIILIAIASLFILARLWSRMEVRA